MKSASKKSLLLATLVLVSVSLWYIYNLNYGSIRYHWHRRLWNEKNKTFMKPVDSLKDYSSGFNKYESYVNETNAIVRLYDEIRIINILRSIPMEQIYRSREEAHEAGKPVANVTSCGRQLALLKQALQQSPAYFEQYGQAGFELSNFMDTYGRPGAGIFSRGADSWLGSFEYCQKAKITKFYNNTNNQDEPLVDDIISGHFCIGHFRFNGWPTTQTLSDPDPALRLGLCLPEVCDSNAIETFNETIDYLAKLQLPENIRQKITLQGLFCLPHEQSPLVQWSLNGRIFFYALASWLTLICVINAYYEFIWRKNDKKRQQEITNHFQQQKESTFSSKLQKGMSDQQPLEFNDRQSPWMKLLIGFSLRNSIKSFTICRKSQEGARVKLCSLNCLKLLMALAIVVSHSLVLSVYKLQTRQAYLDLGRSDLSKFLLSIGRCVDTFLTLFGLTMSYLLLQRFEVHKLANPLIWVTTNLAIFLRLTPLHTLVILFNKWITPHLGSGPWWDYGVGPISSRRICKEAPWYHIIPLTGNLEGYVGPPCNPPAWFLASYSQIALALPFLTYLIGILPTHSIRFLFVAICSLISAGNVATRLYYQQVISSESVRDFGSFAVAVVEKFESSGYIETLGRLGSVLIGSYAGYLLHLYQVGEIRDWPRWFKSRLFQLFIILVHIGLFLLPLLSNKIPKSIAEAQESQITMFQFALINFFMIPLWPVINCILIIAAVTTFNSHVVVRFMSHPLWYAGNKLGLGIYLIHYEVIITFLTFHEVAISNGHSYEVLRLAGFVSILSVILALFVYLFYEAPLAWLVSKLILPAIQRLGSGQTKQTNNGHNIGANMIQDNPNLIRLRPNSNRIVEFIRENDKGADAPEAEEINQFLAKSDKTDAIHQNGVFVKLNLSNQIAESPAFRGDD